jgi:5,5'-dehydrodivanillate O-demethylase
MLTAEDNARLTRVGPGTPMGNLLRRYWHPFLAAGAMEGRWTKRVRLLGEDLVLFKDRSSTTRGTGSGRLGLIAEACPHRRASLAYGIPTETGIRCPYHGWMFDGTGRCLEQPNEPENSAFKDKVTTAGYPVRELAGMLFAYLGPLPAPEIPELDGYRVSPAINMLGSCVLPCNWLQIMENSVDPIHSEWLHGHLQNFGEEQNGTNYRVPNSQRHLKIAFDERPYGIVKRRLKEGQTEDCDDWTVGHPLVFPNILSAGNAAWDNCEYQIRVPVDDEHTLHLWFTSFAVRPGIAIAPELTERLWFYDVPTGEDGFQLDLADHQDFMAWITQGAIADRRLEHLGATDRGIILYRRILERELAKVEAGGDPINVVRTAADALLQLPSERDRAHFSDGFERFMERKSWKYSPVAGELIAYFRRRSTAQHAAAAP